MPRDLSPPLYLKDIGPVNEHDVALASPVPVQSEIIDLASYLKVILEQRNLMEPELQHIRVGKVAFQRDVVIRHPDAHFGRSEEAFF